MKLFPRWFFRQYLQSLLLYGGTFWCRKVNYQRYFQIAENLLYMELGVALEKPKQEICKTIIDYIDQNKID